MHEPQDSTTDKYGGEAHPAFGMVQVSRVSSTPGAVLFDSSVQHSEFIRMTVTGATRKRDLHHDWIHADRKPLIEVDMSMAQWASVVSSIGTSGVPATIRCTETNLDVPGLHAEKRLQESLNDTRGAANRAFDKIKAAMAAVDALDPKAGVKERREALKNLRVAIANSTGNVEFATRSLHEHTENVVQRARADVEAMVVTHAQHLGLEPGSVPTVAIEGGPVA